MTANKLKEVSLKLFAEKGYDATALSEIAEGVGIKKPSIYAHYANKETLFMAVLAETTEGYLEFWQREIIETANLSYKQRLYHLFRQAVDYFAGDAIKISFWIRVSMFPPIALRKQVLDKMRDVHTRITKNVSEIFQEAIDSGQVREGSPDIMATAYFSLLDGYLMRVIAYEDAAYAEKLPELWHCFWLGVAKTDS